MMLLSLNLIIPPILSMSSEFDGYKTQPNSPVSVFSDLEHDHTQLTDDDDFIEYDVQEILDHTTDDQGDWFLVLWAGFSDPTWVPADNMYPNAAEAVHEYFKNKV